MEEKIYIALRKWFQDEQDRNVCNYVDLIWEGEEGEEMVLDGHFDLHNLAAFIAFTLLPTA